MIDETQAVDHGPDEAPFEGMEDDSTSLGFGGQKLDRRLRIGDEVYLLMKCEITSDGREETKKGLKFKAGAKTEILAELTESEATQVAANYG